MTDDPLGLPDAFEQELRDLGPLMAQQERLIAQPPEPAFVRSLRARLVGEPAQPRRRVRITRLRAWSRWLLGGGMSLAAVAVALALLLSRDGNAPRGTKTAAVTVPRPSIADVLRSYPLAGGIGAGGGAPPPWISPLDLPGGVPYSGRLQLRAKALPSGLVQAPAFILKGPEFDAQRIKAIARGLGITGRLRSTTQHGIRWLYLADQPASDQIHSVAISLASGELIYHDTSVASSPVRPGQAASPAQIRAARRWLVRLGWPGMTMPIHSPASVLEREQSWMVRLGWTGAGSSDAPAAVIVVGPDGRVGEAHLWPPIARQVAIQTQTYRSAWTQARDGKTPIGVDGMIGFPARPGSGVLQQASLTEVLTERRNGRLVLAPAYRFAGSVTINRVTGRRNWYAIVPAASG